MATKEFAVTVVIRPPSSWVEDQEETINTLIDQFTEFMEELLANQEDPHVAFTVYVGSADVKEDSNGS